MFYYYCVLENTTNIVKFVITIDEEINDFEGLKVVRISEHTSSLYGKKYVDGKFVVVENKTVTTKQG